MVLPTGSHGLPSAESQGPSSLLDRWKHGGGCDCGGWDMACPLILLGNPSIQFAEDRTLMEGYQTLELFTQVKLEFLINSFTKGLKIDLYRKIVMPQVFLSCFFFFCWFNSSEFNFSIFSSQMNIYASTIG